MFAAAIPVARVVGREGMLTHWGAWLYLISRIVYVLLYVAGIPYVRSLVWLVSPGSTLFVLIGII